MPQACIFGVFDYYNNSRCPERLKSRRSVQTLSPTRFENESVFLIIIVRVLFYDSVKSV